MGEIGKARIGLCVGRPFSASILAASIVVLSLPSPALAQDFMVLPKRVQETTKQTETRQEANPMVQGGTEAGQAGYGQAYSDQMILDRSAQTQTGNQIGNTDNGVDGGSKAEGLAGQLFSISAGLIATGIALNASSKCHCAGMPMIASGIFFKSGGDGANSAGGAMYNMAGISDVRRDDLTSENLQNTSKFNLVNGQNPLVIGGNNTAASLNSSASPSVAGNADATGLRADGRFDSDNANRMSIDEASLSQGKAGEAFAAVEAAYGIDRKELAQAILGGEDIVDFLAKKGALNGKTADEYRAMLTAEKVDPNALREKFENGEYDEYKEIVDFEGEGSAIANNGKADKNKASGNGKGKEKTYAELMAEIFGKNSTIAAAKSEDGSTLSEAAAERDPQLRALASNSAYKLARDYLAGGDFQERNLFERVNRIYRTQSPLLMPEDYFIRLQAERDGRKIR